MNRLSFQEKCHQYWPAERSARYQYFVVDPMAEYNMPQYILREFKVTDARVSWHSLMLSTISCLKQWSPTSQTHSDPLVSSASLGEILASGHIP